MSKYKKQGIYKVDTLYNKILLISRNKRFYTKFGLNDTFENRINLIFLHISFLFIKVKQRDNSNSYYKFYQRMFDYIFRKIEINMREIGFGDTTINKNMRYLVKIFYDILINCENYKEMGKPAKNIFFNKYLEKNNIKNDTDNKPIIEYFNKYEAFCFDLSPDSVLQGELYFNYR